MKDSNFAYYTILATAASVVILMFASLADDPHSSEESGDDPHEISCQHPAGHVIKYKVSGDNARYPLNMKGSMWRFKTDEGKHIISTFCHLEID